MGNDASQPVAPGDLRRPSVSDFIRPRTDSSAPPRHLRGISIVDAVYGDLSNPSKTANVKQQLTKYLDSHPLCGGKHLFFSLPRDSKNKLPGMVDPAHGVDKKLRLVISVDGEETSHILDEYAPLQITSDFALNQAEQEKLQKSTFFEEDELQLLYEGFREASWPARELTTSNFVTLFPQFDNPLVLKSLFSCMDKDGDMTVDFPEYAQAMSQMTRGTLEERIQFAFNILDLDKSGSVEHEEVLQLADQLVEVMSKCGYDDEVFASRHVINMLFQSKRARALNASVAVGEPGPARKTGLTGMFGYTSGGGRMGDRTDSEDDFKRMLKDQGEEVDDDDESGEVEERDYAKLFQESITYTEFKHRARGEPDIANCFGLFKFFNIHIVKPIETTLEGEKEYTLKGWLSKDKGNSPLFSSISVLAYDRRYFVIDSGLLAYYKTDKPGEPILNVLSLASCSVQMGPSPAAWFHLTTPLWSRHMFAEDRREAKRWVNCIRNNTNIILENRMESFAPIRDACRTKWFINGRPYFDELLRVLPRAKKTVYIADWYFSPGVYLKRGAGIEKKYRLDNFLKSVAERGVKIYLIVWNAPSLGFALEPKFLISYLNSLHPNIACICHPTFTPITWSHHQKFVVVDEEVAFVGGVDLCYTRYDDEQYLIIDQEGHNFPGRDYGNLNYVGEANGPSAVDVLDRNVKPRMPWHDIHMMVDGAAARDVALNFLQRWNHAIRSGCSSQLKQTLYLLPYTTEEQSLRGELSPLLSDTTNLFSKCTCQVIRSACAWSAGMIIPEQSIYRGYLHAIKNAQHFIYIENQYFISSITRICPKNRIAEAIYNRVRQAILNKETFRVYFLIPVYPAGDVLAATTRYIIKYVYKTVCRQGNSLFEKLQTEFPDVCIENYVSFCSLRNYGMFKDNSEPATEQVYIHAKLMIVDDRITIIGSANINDRSMRGTRDSEICIYVETPEEHCITATMNGKPYKVSPFAHTLRRSLWEGHLGFKNGTNKDVDLKVALEDPVCERVYLAWTDIARSNTFVYNKVFHYSLPDTVYTLADLKRLQKMAEETKSADPDKLSLWNKKMAEELQQEVRGFLVEFPLNFLKDEQMSPQIWNVEFVVPRNVFL
eukprot:TRINITY_DN2206_c0_g1_i1.p1 TRINITY_DN2206_c0_g1~~TRINITY_DN2206_c0_g1_i1.p1  ORF type:complete len:1114 (+),score=189.00 TRINITY_DN2206_c0_g1_i1:58-3399(+)